MRTLQSKFISSIFALFFLSTLAAQDNDRFQAYHVHEDRVKPSMVLEYEKTAKALADAMRENDIQGYGWLTTSTDDFRYLSVTPIANMAQLDGNPFAALSDKIGNEAASALFAPFNKCYDQHGDYVIFMDKELTYMPDGITQTPDGENFRKFYYVYVSPGDVGAINDAFKKVKQMFADKGSKSYYRVYRSGFGNMDSYFMVAVAAKNPVDMEQRGAANDELLGPDAQAVFGNLMSKAIKFEEITGMIRPELGYTPKSN